jgi:Tol biopolymer transport system component/DNA-binding winged helix-turn-helix (wHTH) protein
MNGSGSDRVKFGPFEADLHTHELWKYGTKLRLVGQPFEVLTILLSKPGELVTREELRGRLWQGDTFVDFNHGLNAAVNKLRECLCDSAESPRYVETLPRRGYRFIAPVERQTYKGTSPNPTRTVNEVFPTEVLPIPEPLAAQNTEVLVPSRRSSKQFFIPAAMLLILALAGTFLFEKVSSSGNLGATGFSAQRIRPLTTLDDETSEPAFSPDGNYVAFHRQSTKPGQSGIFVKAIGTDQLIQLTHNAKDCCPVWAPDRTTIAFSRAVDREFGAKRRQFDIYVVPFTRAEERRLDLGAQPLNATGDGERKLETKGVIPTRPELDWSPDARNIAFTGGSAMYLLSLEDYAVHQLTQPPPLSEDGGPAFSPDGNRLLFVRTPDTGSSSEIMAVSIGGGEPTLITSEHNRILGPPQWSFDARSVIFASDRGSHPALWRVSAEARGPAVEINDSGWYPSVSHRGFRLAYQRITRSLSIWQMDLSVHGKQETHVLLPATSETDQGPGPQFSPDGKKLAYMSDRSGTMEIWVSDRDGSNPFQLTAIGDAGTPRWSPDSQAVVFDARARGERTVYVVNLQSGAPRALMPDNNENVCPSWSQDGKWIYFASNRTHDWQVWKVPAEGGPPVQVTHHGGHAPLMSADGNYIYYAKTPYSNPEVWQVPTDGGAERLLSPLVRPATWASWSVINRGIIFAAPSGNGNPVLRFFDSTRGGVFDVSTLNIVPFWLSATRDGNTVVFDQPGFEQAQIMLVENFR